MRRALFQLLIRLIVTLRKLQGRKVDKLTARNEAILKVRCTFRIASISFTYITISISIHAK